MKKQMTLNKNIKMIIKILLMKTNILINNNYVLILKFFE